MHHKIKTRGVCSQSVSFDLDGDVVKNVSFEGGCNGNLKAICKLVDGMTADQIEKYLAGNTCGYKNTSCADQFAQAVKKARQEESQRNG